ncbi:MAG: hypothetical protein WB765_02520 [Acidimicrobiales bacterium]|jgi:hypothetical protein
MSSAHRPDVAWSNRVDEADWVVERLRHPSEQVVASIVPDGFDAYVRILHPASGGAGHEGSKVRWSEIASWSGYALAGDSAFHAVALRLEETDEPPPWNLAGPRIGTMEGDELAVLVDVLRGHTDTPDKCWFCIWAGYGWQDEAAPASDVGLSLADPPVPPEVRDGSRVELPLRTYLLYSGPIEAALAFVDSEGQSPNLFWPEDRSWCVASEVDLSSTYVGGSNQLSTALLREDRIEAIGAKPSDATSRVDRRVAELVTTSIDALVSKRRVVIDTAVGIVFASLARSRLRRGAATFAIATARANGVVSRGKKATRIGQGEDLRAALEPALTRAVIDLVGR